VINQHRESGAGVILVDAGGFTGTQGATWEPRGLFLAEMMKELGYDAGTLGELEARFGREMFLALCSDASLPLVSANLRDKETGERLLPASRVVERSGVRVGITAVSARSPASLEEIGVESADPLSSLQDVLPSLRKRSDLVVLLARMALPEARQLSTSVRDPIDIIIVGNGVGGRGQVQAEDGGSVYVLGGNRGQALGIAKIFLPADDRPLRILGDEITLDRDVPEDPAALAIVEAFTSNLNDSLARDAVLRVTEQASADGEYYLGADNCKACHPREFELWKETPHSDAFETLILARSESLPECFRCHVTGTRDDAGYDPATVDADQLINVQCEVCHDKGSRHARDGSYGRSLLMDACVKCHNEENSPDFDPLTYWLMMEH
jgi:hypothetical protein